MATRVQGMRRGLLVLGLAFGLWLCGPASTHAAEAVFVVVSVHSPVRSVSQKEVLALFTGRSRSLADGTLLVPVDQQRDGAARAAFYRALTGLDLARIDSYWARLHFTGQVQRPQVLADDASVLRHLRSDASAIGYLAREPADPAVRVVLRLP